MRRLLILAVAAATHEEGDVLVGWCLTRDGAGCVHPPPEEHTASHLSSGGHAPPGRAGTDIRPVDDRGWQRWSIAAAIVAPMSGMSDMKPASTASGPANGTPRIVRTMNVSVPAISAIAIAPAT